MAYAVQMSSGWRESNLFHKSSRSVGVLLIECAYFISFTEMSIKIML
jgi:hypothetical protein